MQIATQYSCKRANVGHLTHIRIETENKKKIYYIFWYQLDCKNLIKRLFNLKLMSLIPAINRPSKG